MFSKNKKQYLTTVKNEKMDQGYNHTLCLVFAPEL